MSARTTKYGAVTVGNWSSKIGSRHRYEKNIKANNEYLRPSLFVRIFRAIWRLFNLMHGK